MEFSLVGIGGAAGRGDFNARIVSGGYEKQLSQPKIWAVSCVFFRANDLNLTGADRAGQKKRMNRAHAVDT